MDDATLWDVAGQAVRFVYRAGRRISEDDQDDLRTLVYLKAQGKTKDVKKPLEWLIIMARRLYIDMERAEDRHQKMTTGLHDESRGYDPYGEVCASLDAETILQHLPGPYADVVLVSMAGYEASEGAAFLGIGEAAYKSRLYRARTKLKRIFGTDGVF